MRKKGTADKHIRILSLPAVLIILFSNLLASISAQLQQQPRYNPADNIAIQCGSSGKTTADDGRQWNGDRSSKLFPTDGQNGISTTSNPTTMYAVPKIPYNTTRLSMSNFTYTIPVTPGPKFLRLHFYFANYGGGFSDKNKAFFTVKAGEYTLLSNFSAADASLETYSVVVKEYIVAVDGSTLAVTFSPDSKDHDGAFAFVNGIEVVSMPASLYYSRQDKIRTITYIGMLEGTSTLSTDTALETMYRINIGGAGIPPERDTGMFRQWDTEDDYLTIRGYSVLPVNSTVNLNFKDNLTSYAAPISVYNTARSMGDGARYSKSQVRSYNLTWGFSVESRFSYLLRLYFCEIATEVTGVGQRLFYVWIDGQAAETKMDVFSMSGGQYVPYFRDFQVLNFNPAGGGKRWANLTVAIMANPDDSMTEYVDAILNGLEILKLSDTDGSLASPNSVKVMASSPKVMASSPMPQSNRKGVNFLLIIGGISGSVIFSCVILFFILRQRIHPNKWMSGTKDNQDPSLTPSFKSDQSRYFSLAEIKLGTDNFSDTLIIGVGGFGNVYKGYIDGGATAVAVKRLKPDSSQGAHEFRTEIETLSRLRHRNLVSLLGYCHQKDEMILVYEYMQRGTLSDHLYKTDKNPPLPWDRRLHVCVCVAAGLHYLHAGATSMIIHRDVKTANILLDEGWTAKVSDFGLSRVGPSCSKGYVSTMVKGSVGYIDPEYYRLLRLTDKSDVYSFGVVLCEVLSGRPPVVWTEEKERMSLAEWACRSYLSDGTLDRIVDPNLRGQIGAECLNKYGEIVVSCLAVDGEKRPSMKQVLTELESAMKLQTGTGGGETINDHELRDADGSDIGIRSGWEDLSGAVFSDIKALNARW